MRTCVTCHQSARCENSSHSVGWELPYPEASRLTPEPTPRDLVLFRQAVVPPWSLGDTYSVTRWYHWTPGSAGPRRGGGIPVSWMGLSSVLVPREKQSAPPPPKRGWLEAVRTYSDQRPLAGLPIRGQNRQLLTHLHPTWGACTTKEAARKRTLLGS